MKPGPRRPRIVLRGCRHCGHDLFLDEAVPETRWVCLLCSRERESLAEVEPAARPTRGEGKVEGA